MSSTESSTSFLTFIEKVERDYLEFIARYFFLNPDFETDGTRHCKILDAIISRLIRKRYRGQPINESTRKQMRQHFLYLFYYFRDMTIQNKLRLNPTTQSAIRKLQKTSVFDRSLLNTFNAQLYLCTAFQTLNYGSKRDKLQEQYVSVGFYSLWKTIEIMDNYIANDGRWLKQKTPPSMTMYKKLSESAEVSIGDKNATSGISVLNKQLHGPLLLRKCRDLETSGFMETLPSTIQNCVWRMFYMHTVMSNLLIPDTQYLDTIMPGVATDITSNVQNILNENTSTAPVLRPFVSKLIQSSISNSVTKKIVSLCPGIENADFSNVDKWFQDIDGSVIEKLYRKQDPYAIYSILRMQTIYISLIRDVSGRPELLNEMTNPWGTFVLQKSDEKKYEKIGCHTIVQKYILDLFKKDSTPTEAQIRDTYVTICKIFAHSFATKYSYISLYNNNECLTIKNKTKLLENKYTSEGIYGRLEKPFIDALLQDYRMDDMGKGDIYNPSFLIKTILSYTTFDPSTKKTTTSPVFYNAVTPIQKNMSSLGIQKKSNGIYESADIEKNTEIISATEAVTDIQTYMSDTDSVAYLMYPNELTTRSFYKDTAPFLRGVVTVLRDELIGLNERYYTTLYREILPALPFTSQPSYRIQRMTLNNLFYVAYKMHSGVYSILSNGVQDMPTCATVMTGGNREELQKELTDNEIKSSSGSAGINSRAGLLKFVRRELFKQLMSESSVPEDTFSSVEEIKQYVTQIEKMDLNYDRIKTDTLLQPRYDVNELDDTKDEYNVMILLKDLYNSLKTTLVEETRDSVTIEHINRLISGIRPTFNNV